MYLASYTVVILVLSSVLVSDNQIDGKDGY